MGLDPNLLVAMPLLCLTPLAMVVLILRHRRAKASLKHSIVLQLIERGAAVPPELLTDSSRTTPYDDLRRGLILSLTGLGVIAFALSLPHHEAWGLGFLPLSAGFGYLITWIIRKRSESAADDA